MAFTAPTLAEMNEKPRACPKGTPRAVTKIVKQRDAAAEERACRKAVDRRDQRRCFFPGCKKTATDKHHIIASSVRGKRIWRTDDILSACALHHGWFKAGLIRVTGNPDVKPVTVHLTALGEAAGITIPTRRPE